MNPEQIEKQPKTAKKLSVLATAALAGLLGTGMATCYELDARWNQGYYKRSAMNVCGFKKFKLQVENPSAFPYSFSPWERYAQIEEELLDKFNISEKEIPRQTKRIISVANQISDRVAKRMLKIMDTYDVSEVSKVATKDSLMNVIADELANAGIFYTPECLLSNSFNPKMHYEGKIHLDCKLLSYLMCHISKRLDLETYLVKGPVHVYLYVVTDHAKDVGYVIEPTEFRTIEKGEGYINYGGKGIGEGFFSTFDRQRTHGGIRATPEFEKAARLHVTIRDTGLIEDDMRANILEGIHEYAKSKGDTDLKIRIYNYLFGIEKRGTNSYLIVSNAFSMSLNLAEECIEKKRYDDAEAMLKNAKWIREEKNELIISKEPIEEILLGKLYWEMGNKYKALQQLREANELYESRGLFYFRGDADRPVALNQYHCLLLRYLATAEIEHGVMSLSQIYNQLVLPAYNHYVANGMERQPEFKKINALKDQLSSRIKAAESAF